MSRPGQRAEVNWALADQAMISGANFLTSIVVVRFVGLGEFGLYTLALTALRFAASTQHALVISPMMSIGPKQGRSGESAYFSSVLLHQVVISAAAGALLFSGMSVVGTWLDRPTFSRLALPVAGATVAFLMQDFARRRFFTMRRPAMAFANDAVSYLGQLALVVALSRVATVDTAMVLWSVATTSGVAALLGLAGSARPIRDWSAFRGVTSRHWHFSKWVLLNAQLDQLGRYCLAWALGALKGAAVVGAFQASANVMGLLHVLYLGVDNVVQPTAARIVATDGLTQARAFIRRMTFLTGIPVVVLCLTVAMFPGQIASLLYGPDLLVGHEPIIVLFCLSYFVMFLRKPLVWFFLATEQTRCVAISRGVESMTSVVLCVPVMQLFDLFGLMWLIIGAAALNVVVLLIEFHRTRWDEIKVAP